MGGGGGGGGGDGEDEDVSRGQSQEQLQYSVTEYPVVNTLQVCSSGHVVEAIKKGQSDVDVDVAVPDCRAITCQRVPDASRVSSTGRSVTHLCHPLHRLFNPLRMSTAYASSRPRRRRRNRKDEAHHMECQRHPQSLLLPAMEHVPLLLVHVRRARGRYCGDAGTEDSKKRPQG